MHAEQAAGALEQDRGRDADGSPGPEPRGRQADPAAAAERGPERRAGSVGERLRFGERVGVGQRRPIGQRVGRTEREGCTERERQAGAERVEVMIRSAVMENSKMNFRRQSLVTVLASFALLALAACDQNPRGSVGEAAPGGRTGEFPSDNRLDDSHTTGEKIGLKGPLAAPAPEKAEAAEHGAAEGAGSAHPAGAAAPGGHHGGPAASAAPAEHH